MCALVFCTRGIHCGTHGRYEKRHLSTVNLYKNIAAGIDWRRLGDCFYCYCWSGHCHSTFPPPYTGFKYSILDVDLVGTVDAVPICWRLVEVIWSVSPGLELSEDHYHQVHGWLHGWSNVILIFSNLRFVGLFMFTFKGGPKRYLSSYVGDMHLHLE